MTSTHTPLVSRKSIKSLSWTKLPKSKKTLETWLVCEDLDTESILYASDNTWGLIVKYKDICRDAYLHAQSLETQATFFLLILESESTPLIRK